ncbi:MAG: PKD domain-containing protein [Bacteroidetes bacterium]|nr:PKD domain-containing protein [Bacteroidota bacterium]
MKKNYIYSLIFLLAGTISANCYAITNALKIKIASNSYSDETVIRYVTGATSGFDGSYDAWKLFSSNTAVPQIYTMIDATSSLSINAYPNLLTDQVVKVYARVGSIGTYTITVSEIGAFASNMDIIIENTACGSFQNLRTNPVYTFYVSDIAAFNSNPGKFKIHFSLPTVFAITNATKAANNGTCIISKQNIDSWSFVVKDASNGIVTSATINRDRDTLTDLAPGMYYFTSSFGTVATQQQKFIISPIISDFSFDTDTLIGLYTTVHFLNQSQNAISYLWDFGDGTSKSTEQNPSHTFSIAGDFPLKLIAQTTACADTMIKMMHVTIATGIDNQSLKENCKLFYSDNVLIVDFNNVIQQQIVLSIFSIEGREIANSKLFGASTFIIPISEQASAIYIVKVQTDETIFTKRILMGVYR